MTAGDNWKDGSVKKNGCYVNPWKEWKDPSFLHTFQWLLTRTHPHVPEDIQRIFPLQTPDWDAIKHPQTNLQCTWIGHATCFVQLDGVNILTDPVFSFRCSPVQFAGPGRYVPVPCNISDLPPVDIVVISHNHHDHLDTGSIEELEKLHKPTFFCGIGLKWWFQGMNISDDRIVEMDWWQSHSCKDLNIQFIPVQHWSQRFLTDGFKTLWGGYVIKGTKTFFFNGDTGFAQELYEEIGRRCGPMDLAAIPVGSYAPRWMMRPQHVDPEEAYMIHKLIGAKQTLGIHHGTWVLTDEPIDEPRRRVGLINDPTFFTVDHGTTFVIEKNGSINFEKNKTKK